MEEWQRAGGVGVEEWEKDASQRMHLTRGATPQKGVLLQERSFLHMVFF